ncbi:MAG: LuxR C-terminal-related transcriptional regulator [Lachnospiraceae bacterium]|nr:LuxR C-terminal-related transcriptional regulator [Lachnospiraceae bacterium]
MEERFIKVPILFQKLKQAEEEHCLLYIKALGGYGKSTAVQHYLRSKSHLTISGAEGFFDTMPPPETIRQGVVVIDDISFLKEKESIRYLGSLLERSDKWFILIGRSPLPMWLQAQIANRKVLFAVERDLMWDAQQTRKFLADYEVEVTPEEAEQIAADTVGHVVTLKLLAQRMRDGLPYGAEAAEKTRIDLYRYLDHAFYESWDEELKQAMLRLAGFDSFTLPMAQMITGCGNASLLLEKAMTLSEFLQSDGQGNYRMRSILREYLLWKQSSELTGEQYNNLYYNAGLYFELQGDIKQALACYDKSKSQGKIAELLIKNSMKHPGNGHYYETRAYYLNLPKEQVETSPILMAGLSMLHSLLMQTRESEQWYEALKAFEQKPGLSNNQKKEARSRLAYLDIALPHRGSVGLSNILENAAMLCRQRSVVLTEFSITSNMPSVMNGGKDFCEWSKIDRELAKTLKKPVELVLGNFGAGLVNVALAESAFEKGSMDAYEILSLLNSGYIIADTKGTAEMCFAIIGVMTRIHISRKQPQRAASLLMDFKEKVIREGHHHLLPNINALSVAIGLFTGKVEAASQWIADEAPNENVEFYILERYRYLVKIKAYLALGRLEEAASLIERLSYYFEQYQRNYQQIENGLLRAIVQYRMHLGNWKQSLTEALQKAEGYRFVPVAAEYGVALHPLMKEAGDLDLANEYRQRLEQAVREYALGYPKYLEATQTLTQPLTDMEAKLLPLLCSGASLEEIAARCGITYNTVKYHNRNIYRKLGVKNRQQVQVAARQLGLYGGT